MRPELPEGFQQHLGLSSIVLVDEAPDREELPSDSRLQPADAAVEVRLQGLLQAETFDHLILEAIRPEVFDREMLAPSRFHLLRERVTDRLTALRAATRAPEPAAELDAALEVLLRRSREHELGEALRYALLKG
jgi:hypothetical protein